MTIKRCTQKGFTLLEILLVVAAIAILAGIVIIAINPSKQLGDTKNTQRRSDVTTILNAVYQYSIDNKGVLPTAISSTSAEICLSSVASTTCASAGLVSLGTELTTNEKYITAIPSDPLASTTNGTGYFIQKSSNNRVTVYAPAAEQGVSISVTR